MNKVSCIFLAAGQSKRMGQNKLLMSFNGEPIVRRTYNLARSLNFNEVVVVTGHDSQKIQKVLGQNDHQIIFNEDYKTGMHSSIVKGLKGLSKDCDGVMIWLADQPMLSQKAMSKLLEEGLVDGDILVPFYNDRKGNPVIISSSYFAEILEEPNGDYGCSYLLKRYPDKIKKTNIEDDSILLDVDTKEQFDSLLKRASNNKNPFKNYLDTLSEQTNQNQPFAMATVIEVIGSSSAKVGSKAVFDEVGKNIQGWIGGGCAERFVGEECVSAINEGKSRIIIADLDDEVFGLGVDCGGKMRIFIDPIMPSEELELDCPLEYRPTLQRLASFYGWSFSFTGKENKSLEKTIFAMAQSMANKRGATFKPLREVKKVEASFKEIKNNKASGVKIVGRTRITEALARHFNLFNLPVTVYGTDIESNDYPSNVNCKVVEDSYLKIKFDKNDIVIVASHTARDSRIVENALNDQASYVGMIGSLKRSGEVLGHLDKLGQVVEEPLFIPSGLDIDAKNPDEIALSVLVEYLLTMQN